MAQVGKVCLEVHLHLLVQMPLLLIIYQTVFKIYVMKKILLFIFTLFSLSYFFGQGNNLQFSQALIVPLANTETVQLEKFGKLFLLLLHYLLLQVVIHHLIFIFK